MGKKVIYVHAHFTPKYSKTTGEGANEYSYSKEPLNLGHAEIETFTLEEFQKKYPKADGLREVILGTVPLPHIA